MPWTADDAEGHTSHADTPQKRKQWAAVANAALKNGDSEGAAIRQANAAIHKTEVADKVMKYLLEADPRIAALIEKESLSVGDTHVPTALGNENKRKRLSFAEALAQGKKPQSSVADPAPATEVAAKADFPLRITKMDAEQQKVFGWAYVAQRGDHLIVDKQGDIILPTDLELAAHDYALHWRTQGDMHMLDKNNMPVPHGRMIESVIFTTEKAQAGLKAIDPETGENLYGWFVAFKVDDPALWEAHKRGERPEFSIGGRGRRVEINVNA